MEERANNTKGTGADTVEDSLATTGCRMEDIFNSDDDMVSEEDPTESDLND